MAWVVGGAGLLGTAVSRALAEHGAGVLQLVRYQAVQLAPLGVRVNAIVPGPFPIPDTQGGDAAFMANLKAKVPMGRVGHPEEIVGAVVFLSSDASSYVTGTQIVVDGGWTAW